MREYLNFYIDGRWVPPVTAKRLDVIDPATATVNGCINVGSTADVDAAVKAARAQSLRELVGQPPRGAHRRARAHRRRVRAPAG